MAEAPQVLPAALRPDWPPRLAGDPRRHLAPAPEPTVRRLPRQGLAQLLPAGLVQQRPRRAAGVVAPLVAQGGRATGVVALGHLLHPAAAVAGGCHHRAGGLAPAEQPDDLVVRALHRVPSRPIAPRQLLAGQMRLQFDRLRHNAIVYTRSWYNASRAPGTAGAGPGWSGRSRPPASRCSPAAASPAPADTAAPRRAAAA